MVQMSIIYAACVAGAIGLLFLLPRRGNRWWPIGAVLGGGALGAGLLALARGGGGGGVDLFFYLLAFLAIGAAVRMITHSRPVYAALYFILVVLATAGLFVQLAAEFMAFALIIVYAGAILITYLFVIMLAQEAPDDQHPDALTEYDATAREPVAATVAGFVLLAALLGMMYRGTGAMPAHAAAHRTADAELAVLTGKVQAALRAADLIRPGETIREVDAEARTAVAAQDSGDGLRTVALPDDLRVSNVDAVGVSLLSEFPVSLEVAGVILMLAMLGAVVLARKERVGTPRDSKSGNTPHDSQSLIVGAEGAL
ncbi:MAG: NADH-quinone oxidoreductase subunit J [Phycisphaerales bacterium]|nr:NADH-quinone oxidoreductase subunit J [Phycisphaerales bacterium]